MAYLIEYFGLAWGWLLSAGFVFFRYVFIAGLAFAFFYGWKRQRFQHRKIQQRPLRKGQIGFEIATSALTALVFACMGLLIYAIKQAGWSAIYLDVQQYGVAYMLGSFVLLVLLHDAYFYWMHRAIHHPALFAKLHAVHHHSNNPTPWTSLAFHPLEAILEIAIIPIVVVFMPLHPIVLLAFAFWSMLWNVVGHLGYELFPAWWAQHPVLGWFNTATHHNMHHRYGHHNYSLYFNWWDRWCSTNHPNYKEQFADVTRQPQQQQRA